MSDAERITIIVRSGCSATGVESPIAAEEIRQHIKGRFSAEKSSELMWQCIGYCCCSIFWALICGPCYSCSTNEKLRTVCIDVCTDVLERHFEKVKLEESSIHLKPCCTCFSSVHLSFKVAGKKEDVF
jgi:hypothetical protein